MTTSTGTILMAGNAFPRLPLPIGPSERGGLLKKISEWSVRPRNGEVLGRVFERLARSHDFEAAWSALSRISGYDDKIGKFSVNLINVADIVGEFMPIERIGKIYEVVEGCLRHGWRLHPAVPGMSYGFARRVEAMQWLPILSGLAACIDRQYLDGQIAAALAYLLPIENSGHYPFATDKFVNGLVGFLHDDGEADRWRTQLEQRPGAREDHERRLDLIQESVQNARQSEHASAGLAQCAIALIRLGECAHVERLAREVPSLPASEQAAFIRELVRFSVFDLQNINHEGAVRALVNCCTTLLIDNKARDWSIPATYEVIE